MATAALLLAGSGVADARPATQAPDVGSLAASAGCGKAPTLTSGPRTIQSSGKSRSFILRIPDGYDNNRPYRLIFGYHWRGGTANDVDSGGTDGFNWSYYGLRRLSNNGAIFVAPQGLGNGWANSGGEDVTFTDDMIRLIEADLCVETTQRFALGFSFGGGMSYALACARANMFRAVAVYSGAQISGCSGGTQPIAYIGIHGIGDTVLNISLGRSLRDTFVRNNGCTPQNPPEPAPGSRTHITTAYSGCRSGFPVVWAAFDGGHTPGPIDGSTSEGWMTWTSAEVWRFFTGDTTPPPPPPPTFRLRGEASGRCLDVNGASSANGAQMIIWDCHTGANQQFTQNGRALQVMGKCLDLPTNATAGARVQIWDCHGGANQQWNVNGNGTISNVQTGLCLDVNGASTANGSAVIVWSCHTGANQRWSRA
ncbi:MAG TPA: RICIN domain-containing protein [Actinophytocola sp.]|uniref:ricin-type beta-trefoil lectin domain protein n=1 Tax=Actinophytocola sp. TaxID=1872138 RepID=UPI002DDD5166|nr:RICIN domain-containing protein [Actinophytocola sp.]HEV2780693.1 RICIN domain-containing protein [Actinophytocola sp.]